MPQPTHIAPVFPTDSSAYLPLLRERFGYQEFRSGQSDALTHLGQGDVLAIMPTGSGKSLCYVLPALCVGRTLVVSPLIALMQDQVESQQAAGVRSTFINSSLNRDEQNERYTRFVRGEIDLLYVSPERFRNERFVAGLASVGVNLLAIDEAHCVSEWGHDFRPDYLLLGSVRERLGMPRTLALTATADPRVREEIVARLGIKTSVKQIVAPVDRPNLQLKVEWLPYPDERLAWTVDYAREHLGKSGIIYARSRADTEKLANALKEATVPTEHYHAGLRSDVRAAVQRRFLTDETQVVVATVAFGLGVNKPDVRYVLHFNMPGSLEAYYQQAGRAGRDGGSAECVLCYGPQERPAQQSFINRAHPSDADVKGFWQTWVRSGSIELPNSLMPDAEGQTNGDWAMAVSALRSSKLVDDLGRRLSSDPDVLISTKVITDHFNQTCARLDKIQRYATSRECRKTQILRYFGEQPGGPCGTCDNCSTSGVPEVIPQPVQHTASRRSEPVDMAFETSSAVAHDLFVVLRTWRKDRATRDGVPAYVICGDSTLNELADRRPHSLSDLKRIFGMGTVRIERHGEEILGVIAQFEANSSIPP